MKTYLVAGGAGFLGSNLIERLIVDPDNHIICIDNLITGKKENISQYQSKTNFEYINADISQPLKIKNKIDFVLNYACPASPIDYRAKAVETLDASSAGVRNLLEIAKHNQARFFHTSTSEVYGDPLEHPQKETYWGHVNPYGERSCYDEGKRFAEALIYIYRHDYKVNTGIVRIFNTYGPNMQPDDGRVVSNFIRQALCGEDITVYGQGLQTRSFCYVSDQIEGQLKLIHSNIEGPINIGNPCEFTIIELAEKVIALTNSKSKIIHCDLPKDDPTQRRPDISLAKQYLDWSPVVDLDEGLRKTIEWFRSNQEKLK